MKHQKTGLIVLLALLLLAYLFFDLGRFLTWSYFQSSRESLTVAFENHPAQTVVIYFLIYVLSAAVSLPGATILTLLAGTMFGLGVGVMLVSVASTVGATLAMLTARFLLRDVVVQRFGQFLDGINDGIQKDGVWYLLTLRLIPVVPFFALNLLMGLTRIRIPTYFWVSQLGMFPATVLYVNAGTQIALIESPGEVASLGVILSFSALALFPWLMKWTIARWRNHAALARWRALKPRQFDRNLIVIGAGAAGLVSAYIAAAVKARVTLIESHQMGGDCLNFGCVPSKALIKSARIARQVQRAQAFGISTGTVQVNFSKVIARVFSVIQSIAPHDSVQRYTDLGAEVLMGRARIVDPWHVEIQAPDGKVQRLSTRRIVLATGAAPVVPTIAGLEEVDYLTSETVWQRLSERSEVPKRIAIIGGGPVGCELAQAFVGLGSSVVLIQRNQRLLPREDREVSAAALEALTGDGVQVQLGTNILRIQKGQSANRIWIEREGREEPLEFDLLLCAVGRLPRLKGLGLEGLGFKTSRHLEVDEYLQTSVPTIYAAGDVLDLTQHTHAAAHQAWYATVNALFGALWRFKLDMRVVPQAVFLAPEIARVGLNEEEALAQGVFYEVTRFEISELDRAIADGVAHGFIKILTVPGKDRILGVTIVAEHAAEMLAEYVLAMRHGLGLNKILSTVHTYPTMSEANKYAAGAWKRAHAPAKILALLEKFHRWRLG